MPKKLLKALEKDASERVFKDVPERDFDSGRQYSHMSRQG